jgi:FAD/FMN-containing dehydrogenase
MRPATATDQSAHPGVLLTDGFAARFQGELLRPGSPGYDEARSVWNGMIDRSPALVARCATVYDVVACVELAAEQDLLVAVRGGGHNVAGTAVCDGGLVIDLSRMRKVDVDPASGTVRAQAGATWGDVDRATQPYGLAVPGGVVSTTGIAGLTLSGGLSWQRRRHGMTIDNLLAAELVTADGSVIRAGGGENPDLLWALKGGGGNFGVVTSFEYQAHALGPEVYATQVVYPLEQARQVLAGWRDALDGAPDEITSDADLWSLPADPEVPPELHGAPVVIVEALYAGPPDEAEGALDPLRRLGEPLVDETGRLPYLELQSKLDALAPAGLRYYWKALYVDGLGDDLIDLLVVRAAERPSAMGPVVIRQLGGAVARVPATATAFGDRSAPFNVSVDAIWEDPADDAANVDWTRDVWGELHRFSTGQAYLNFPGQLEEGEQLLRASYGANYERLEAVKTIYDPTNLFRVNHNIAPRHEARKLR